MLEPNKDTRAIPFTESSKDDAAVSEDEDNKNIINHNTTHLRTDAFPDKLHDMLDFVSENSLSHIASWEMNGCAFQVHDIDLLVKQVVLIFSNKANLKVFSVN